MPPNQPQSSQFVYDQCFCNSVLLTAFATTPDAICVAECQIQTDRQVLRSWYNNFCAQVRNGVDPTTTTSTAPAGTPVVATSTISISSGTVAATVTATSSATNTGASHADQTWIAGHWKWVLMLAILVIGLAGLTFLAVWLKRRHRRKLEAQRAAASGFGYDPEKRPANDPRRSATPDLWGPHQMMQATQGYGYTAEGVEEPGPEPGPGKRTSRKMRKVESTAQPARDDIEITEVDRGRVGTRPSMKRARPSELETNARLIGAADRRSKTKHKQKNDHEVYDKEVEAGRSERPKSKSRSRAVDSEKT